MKTIYLIRHSKAVNADFLIKDFDRSLTQKGVDNTIAIANFFKSKNINPQIILSSDAVRSVSTAVILANELAINSSNIKLINKLYESNIQYYLKEISILSNAHNHIFVVAHNPTILQFANYLCNAIDFSMPTTGVIAINIDINTWQQINNKKGSLLFFTSPKQL